MIINADSAILSFWRVYRVPLFFAACSLVCVGFAIVLLVRYVYPQSDIEFRSVSFDHEVSTQSAQTNGLGKVYMVDVEGAIFHPGVIQVPSGSRVEDVLVRAGGLRDDADQAYIARYINRAMKVADGMKLYIPTMNETSYNNENKNNSDANVAQYNKIGNQSDAGGGVAGRISINAASKDQLDTLPGIGPVTAQKIIDNRPYQTVDELVSKKAVGQSVFETIRSLVDL